MHIWRGKYRSFMRRAQMDFCWRLIVVPLTTFHRLSEMIGDPQGELIFLFQTGRCGSTLLSQVRMCYWLSGNILTVIISKTSKTRKLSYRKDDRAMRPIYGCPENVRESLSTPTATFPEIFNGLLIRSIPCVQNLKFVGQAKWVGLLAIDTATSGRNGECCKPTLSLNLIVARQSYLSDFASSPTFDESRN